MNESQFSRRAILKAALAATASAGLGRAFAQSPPASSSPTAPAALKVSLNVYSFNQLLLDGQAGKTPGTSLMELLDFCAKERFDGIDATGYYFPGYPKRAADAYIDGFKRKAAGLGIGISGTGVRNAFTTSDKAVRDADIVHVKEWVEVAARLGAPVLRVFADTRTTGQTWQMVAKGFTREQVQEWMVAAIRECAEHGGRHGVLIGVQNHGDFIRTGKEHLALIDAVGSKWCAPIVDTGSYKTDDPYADIALVAPRAVNWQVKTSPVDPDSPEKTDLAKLLKIIRASKYRGYLPIETLVPTGKPYDPYTLVPKFLADVRKAIAETAGA